MRLSWRKALAWARLGVCIWGREADAGAEEAVSGSRGDKQLAPRVCSCPTGEMWLGGICLWELGVFALVSDRGGFSGQKLLVPL